MLFRAVEHRKFSKFCKFEARYLKNGRSHKKFCLHSKSSKSGQKYIRTIKITKNFFLRYTKFCSFAKKLPRARFRVPDFFNPLPHGHISSHRIAMKTSKTGTGSKYKTFLLLPKNDHGPDFVYRIFSITIDSRKCFKKETLWPFTFQQDIG